MGASGPTELLDIEQQRMLQEGLLADQLERVRAGSPFFAERLTDRVASLDELASLPFVKKDELRAAQAEHPPLGAIAGTSFERINRLHVTSGTTGTPLFIGFTRADHLNSSDLGSRAFAAAGVRPEHRILHCLNYAFYVGGIADHMSVEATGATVIPVGIGQSERLLELFAILKPNAMFSITSYGFHLAEMARSHGMEPSELGLELLITGGEAGGDIVETRARLEDIFGARVGDTYGLGEVWPTCAGHCIVRDGLHLVGPEFLIVELIDTATESPVEWKDGAEGELVFTHLQREASPLVRYRSGDVVRVLSCACECGRKTPRIRLIGRSDDMFVVRGVNVFPSAIERVLSESVPGFRGFAVVLEARVPEPPIPVFIEAEEPADVEAAEHRLRDALQVRIHVEQMPKGTIGFTQHKARRIWRIYEGQKPEWMERTGRIS